MKPEFYIGLDLGTSFGWGVLRADGTHIASGAWNLKVGPAEGRGLKFVRLQAYLDHLLRFAPAVVAFERMGGLKSVDAQESLFGCVGIVQAWCESNGLEAYGPVHNAAVKKAATGVGNAKKPEMVKAAEVMWGACCLNSEAPKSKSKANPREDEADALWIAETMRRDIEWLRRRG